MNCKLLIFFIFRPKVREQVACCCKTMFESGLIKLLIIIKIDFRIFCTDGSQENMTVIIKIKHRSNGPVVFRIKIPDLTFFTLRSTNNNLWSLLHLTSQYTNWSLFEYTPGLGVLKGAAGCPLLRPRIVPKSWIQKLNSEHQAEKNK